MNTTDTPATQAHARHMQNLTEVPRSKDDVDDYIEGVSRAEGKYRAKLLRDDYFKWMTGQERKR